MMKNLEQIERAIAEQEIINGNCEAHLRSLNDFLELFKKCAELEETTKEFAERLANYQAELSNLRRINGYLEALRLSDGIEIAGLKNVIKNGTSAAKIRDAAGKIATIQIPKGEGHDRSKNSD